MGWFGKKKARPKSGRTIAIDTIRSNEYDVKSSSKYGVTPIQYATIYYYDRSLLDLDDEGFRRARYLETTMILGVDDDFRTYLTRWGEGIIDGSVRTSTSVPGYLY